MIIEYNPFRIYIKQLIFESPDNPWPDRLIFIFLTLINTAAYLNPWIDTDFGPLMAWMDSVNSITDPSQLTPEMMQAPWTMGTLLAVLLPMAAEMITFIFVLIYIGMHLITNRKADLLDYEENKVTEIAGIPVTPPILTPPKLSTVVARTLLLLLILAVFGIPLSIAFFIFFILVIVIMPILIAFPAAFIAGDFKISEVIPFLIKRARSVYGFNARNLAFCLAANLVVGFVIGITGYIEALTPVYYVLNAAATSWFALVYAKLGLRSYEIMATLHFDHSDKGNMNNQKGKEE